MLRGIQKATSNWLGRIVVGIILGLIAVSFVIWGVGDIFRGFGQSTIAKVGDREIRIEDFRNTYQEQIQQISRRAGRPITPDQVRALGLDRQILARTVAETVLDERARMLGLGVSDDEIARRITDDPNFRGLSGAFDRARFDQLIRSAGYTEARFLAEQRRVMLRQQLVGTVSGDVIAPRTSADVLNRYQNEQRTIDMVTLRAAQAGEIDAPSPEALQKYFDERKMMFRAPEYRKLVLLVLTPAEIAAGAEISDADAKTAYDQRRDRYVTPERRQVQQIGFQSDEEARAAVDKIKAGASFADIAKERGIEEKDTGLGTVSKAELADPAIAEAAFALKEGEVSEPVKGRLVTALLRVVAVAPAKTRPFEEVAAELKTELAAERARVAISGTHDKVEDERLGGASLTDIAKKLNLKLRTIEATDRSGRAPDGSPVDLPPGIDVLSQAFVADVGAENDPINVPANGGYVWYEVVQSTPARERTFDEMKAELATRWREDEIANRLEAKAKVMLEKLKEGTPLAAVAAAEGVNVEWKPGLRRGAAAPGVPARALDVVFRTPQGQAATTDGASPTERIVFQVGEITVPTLDAESEQAGKILEALQRSIAEEMTAEYLARLEKEIGVTINQSALNQIVGGRTN